jgi:hypothetical protein
VTSNCIHWNSGRSGFRRRETLSPAARHANPRCAYRLIKTSVRQAGGRAKNPDAFISVEGKLTRIAYKAPAGRSVLEVFRNYELGRIAKLLASRPQFKVLIAGHTDNVGALDYNRSLSERRAQSVIESLVKQHGVARDRLTAAGVGMAAPIASNDGEAGRAKNRRVELVKR